MRRTRTTERHDERWLLDRALRVVGKGGVREWLTPDDMPFSVFASKHFKIACDSATCTYNPYTLVDVLCLGLKPGFNGSVLSKYRSTPFSNILDEVHPEAVEQFSISPHLTARGLLVHLATLVFMAALYDIVRAYRFIELANARHSERKEDLTAYEQFQYHYHPNPGMISFVSEWLTGVHRVPNG